MHSVVRPDDSYKYLCWRCLALGGAATARGGAPQPAVQGLGGASETLYEYAPLLVKGAEVVRCLRSPVGGLKSTSGD